MRTDLIGDDFRLDLNDADDAGIRHGVAKLGERTAAVAVLPAVPADPDYLRIYLDFAYEARARFWVDVAPAVKRAMEAKQPV